jgi:hypothetical protein
MRDAAAEGDAARESIKTRELALRSRCEVRES